MSLGLYVHVPFCSALCPYCDFAVVVGRSEQHAAYCDALVEEGKAKTWGETASTVFVGGGTPTLVDAPMLADALDRLFGIIPVEPDAEITVEANPDSITTSGLRALRANRVSIGAQSFDDDVLRGLGRTHSSRDVVAAVEAARAAGLDDVSVDLIYGGHGEDDASWARSLARAIELGVEHVSCYALTIEERTPFGSAVARGAMRAPDDDALATRFEMAVDALGAAGFEHYEISNWARPGKRCAHNMNYWTQGDYLGLGLGAHSHRAGHRWWNTRALQRYLADPARAVDGEERLDDRARAEEWVSLRLRLSGGVVMEDLETRLGVIGVEPLVAGGLVAIDQGVLRLTTRGMLLDNDVTGAIVASERAARERFVDLGS